ncbi:MAG TPA: hypothetical protein VH595_10800 [Verrucomicrobiae bacterium]|nr:hypothetical protein [Verrucomicrobiae bacterium]
MKEKTSEKARDSAPTSAAGRVRLGAFGKHPGWSDFMEHVGTETSFMVRAKRDFFLGTIRNLVATGQWQGAPGDTAFFPREWLWIWQEKNEFLIGLLWPSRDGTGSARKFPMALCANCQDVDVFWALEHLFPILSRAAKKLREVKTQAEVSQCVQEAQQQCADVMSTADSPGGFDYLAQAGKFFNQEWLRDNPEAPPRTLYFIHTRLESLAIGAKEIARKKAEEFDAMRLPYPPDGAPAEAAKWIAFFRTQIDNDAPLLLVRSSGSSWCDVILGGISADGKLSERNTLRLQQGLGDAPLITDTPYPLDPDFLAQSRQTLASAPLEWGNPAKRSIFGPVPPKYRPNLPGEKNTKATEHALGDSDHAKTLKRIMIGAGCVLALGILIVLVCYLFRSSPKAPSPAPAPPPSPQHTNASSDDNTQNLQAAWTEYIRDYTNWLKPLVDSGGAASFDSPYLTTNLQRLIAGARVANFAPLALYGSADPLNLTEPDPKELKAKQDILQRTYAARDQARSLIQNQYPAKVAADVNELAGTPLETAARVLLSARPPDGESFIQQATRLTVVEHATANLKEEWNKLEKVQNELAQFDPNYLAYLLDEKKGRVGAANVDEAAAQLAALRKNEENLLDWVKPAWSRVDQSRFLAELARTNISSIEAWTNLAGEYTKIFTDSDPRAALRNRLDQTETNQLRDVVLAANDGNSASIAGLTNQAGHINSEIAEMNNVAAIRKNQAALNGRITAVDAEIGSLTGQTQEAWDKIFDFNQLMKQQRDTAFENSLAQRIWTDYLGNAENMIHAQTQPLPRKVLLDWRKKFEAARTFIESVAKLTNDPIFSRLVAFPQGNNLFADYCAGLVKLNLDSDLGIIQPFAEFAAGQKKAELDQTAANFASALGELLSGLCIASKGAIPSNVDEFRAKFDIVNSNGVFAVADIPQMTLLQELDHTIWDSSLKVSDVSAGLLRDPPPDALHMAMGMARLNENHDWPGGVADWKSAAEVARAVQREIAQNPAGIDANSASRNVASWLAAQWGKTSPHITSFGDIKLCRNAISDNAPENLEYNYKLAKLIDSFDDGDVLAFQKRTDEFLNAEKPAVHREVLQRILNLPSDGTDWNSLAPARHGITIDHAVAENPRLARAGVSNSFKLMKLPNDGRVFVSVSEFSCADFIRLANQSDLRVFTVKWFTNLQETLNGAGVATPQFFLDPLNYLNNLAPRTDGGRLIGLQLRSPRTTSLDSKFADSPVLQRCATVTPSQPVNFVSPEIASLAAEAWGCRLLTPTEWRAIDSSFSGDAEVNLRSNRFDNVYQALSQGLGSSKELIPLFFYKVPPAAAAKSGSDSVDSADSLFSEVDDSRFQKGGLAHWRGNVAEYLREGGEYFVAGGSFASLPADNCDPQQVPKDQLERGYADVGFRLAFDWVGAKPSDQIRESLAQLRPAPSN